MRAAYARKPAIRLNPHSKSGHTSSTTAPKSKAAPEHFLPSRRAT
jgi:hypothetical protein